MKILKINVMRGPNYWSVYHRNLIVLSFDLENFANILSNQLPNFNEKLKSLIPSLYEHRCSLAREGGFLERLNQGTLLGHVIEHVALELQTLAGMDCGFGRTRESNTPGVYNIVFSYQIESAGILSAKIAKEIIETLANGEAYKYLEDDIEELREIYSQNRPGPSTESIVNEAIDRNIPVNYQNGTQLLLGYGSKQRKVSATMTDRTSAIGMDIVADKNLTKKILSAQYVPIPKGETIRSVDELEDCIKDLGFPLAIKPCFGNHGRGITTKIYSVEKAYEAFELARTVSRSVVVERYIEGDDYRFLVINYKLVAAAKRLPASIFGDGTSTIAELISKVNANPNRGVGHENILTKITIDSSTENILKENNLTLESVLPNGRELLLKYTANISTGGVAVDVTDEVHRKNIRLAERIARIVNLDVCGIDLIAEDISKPITQKHGAILEVNAAPGFRMHLSPNVGLGRNVARQIIEMLYHDGDSRIPIVAVTGTNGKTSTVRLIAHLASQAGNKVGMTTTEGLYIDGSLIHQGDCSGPRSAHDVLSDPIVEFAVLECARGGILRSGLGFDECSTSIVTNISEDHLGVSGIDTLDELTKIKAVVPRSTQKNGYAILNADDQRVYDMQFELDCRIALFAMSKSDLIVKHCMNGNLGCYYENDNIYLWHNKEIIKISKMNDVPLTFNGKLECMKPNILAAVLAAWVNGIDVKGIQKGLASFHPTHKNLPGRFNIFKFATCDVIVDYAHNENAYKALKDFVMQVPANYKIGIIAGTGDRRKEDIEKTGFYAAQMFDEIIIRHENDPRGRTNAEIENLLLNGIEHMHGQSIVHIIPDEFAALESAILNAKEGTLICHFPENVMRTIAFLKKMTNKQKTNLIKDHK